MSVVVNSICAFFSIMLSNFVIANIAHCLEVPLKLFKATILLKKLLRNKAMKDSLSNLSYFRTNTEYRLLKKN